MGRVHCGISILGLLVCGLSMPALAEPSQKDEALHHYQRGLSLVQSHAYGEAIAELNQAYDIGHDAQVLYDIAHAYVAIDQPVFASDMLKKYLSLAGSSLLQAKLDVVEAEISKQEERIATLLVQTNVASAVLRVDGIEVGKLPMTDALRMNAGAHLIAISAVGFQPWEQPLELAGRERRTLDIRLQRVPAVGLTDASTSGAASPPMSTGRKLALALGGLGVAAIAIGSVYGIRAIAKKHDSDALCPQDQCTQAGVDLNNEAKSAARVSDVAFGVGLASAAVATYLFLRSPKYQPTAEADADQPVRWLADVRPGHAGVLLRATW
jgi:hypothetical protein